MSNTNKTAFINCPYDDEYKSLFQLLVYLCAYFSYEPRFASEDYSSSSRTKKIIEMIKETSVGIHDISRIALTDGYPRFNMPFELGMDYIYTEEFNDDRKILVLDGNNNDYKRTLSDLNCSDIDAHENKPKKLISIVRNFFIGIEQLSDVPSPEKIFKEFRTLFKPWLSQNLKTNGVKSSLIAMNEYKNKVWMFFDKTNIVTRPT